MNLGPLDTASPDALLVLRVCEAAASTLRKEASVPLSMSDRAAVELVTLALGPVVNDDEEEE